MNKLSQSISKLTDCVVCKLLLVMCCYPGQRNQRVEKGLIDGVGFSRLSENVRSTSSQVVNCDPNQRNANIKNRCTTSLCLVAGRSNPSLRRRLCCVHSGRRTKVLTREKPCHPGTCDGRLPFRSFLNESRSSG